MSKGTSGNFKNIINMWDTLTLLILIRKQEDFSQKSCFKKWYKKDYLRIMDSMLVHSCIAWNMSAKLKGVFRTTLDNATLRMYVAKYMLHWKDPIDENKSPIVLPVIIDNHLAKPISKSEAACIWYLVCGSESSIPWNHIVICLNPKCGMSAHSHIPDKTNSSFSRFKKFMGCLVFRWLIMNNQMDYSLLYWTIRATKISKNFLKNHNKRNQQKRYMLYAIGFNVCMPTVWWKKMKKATVTNRLVNITLEMNGKVANLVIFLRTCLKHPCEEYSKMGLSKLKMYFNNIP